MLDFAAMENALHAWLTAETGVQVILSRQGGPRPGDSYATLRVSEGATHGFPAEVRRKVNPAPSGDGGDELQQDAVLRKELVASVQAFTPADTGNASAQALLSRAQAGLEKPSRLEAFRAAGLALVDRGTVQDVTALLETRFEGRAALQVRFLVWDKVSDFTGYIATANVTPNL